MIGASGSNAATGAGTTTTESASQKTERFATAKFALHAGLAFGAFHRYIYKPYKARKFDRPNGRFARARTYAKAGLAGAFAVHETRLAIRNARKSESLAGLVDALVALQGRFGGLVPGLGGAGLDAAELDRIDGAVRDITRRSAGAGTTVTEPAKIPLAG